MAFRCKSELQVLGAEHVDALGKLKSRAYEEC